MVSATRLPTPPSVTWFSSVTTPCFTLPIWSSSAAASNGLMVCRCRCRIETPALARAARARIASSVQMPLVTTRTSVPAARTRISPSLIGVSNSRGTDPRSTRHQTGPSTESAAAQIDSTSVASPVSRIVMLGIDRITAISSIA